MLVKVPEPDDFTVEMCAIYKKESMDKRVAEDEMAGQHHQFNGHEIGQTLGDSDGQGGLVCCSPLGHKESDTTWRLNNKVSQT